MNGFDPYSNSKSCSEFVTSALIKSYFNSMSVAVSTVRAGNVIGGGDFAEYRNIPDCIRAFENGMDIIVYNLFSTEPYEHVLEPIVAYLMIAMKQYENKEKYAGNYNIEPDEADCLTTGEMVSIFVKSGIMLPEILLNGLYRMMVVRMKQGP